MNDRSRDEAPSGLSGAGIACAVISALGFSTLGIFAEGLFARGFSVPQTLAWRFTVASGFLWVFLGIKRVWRASGQAKNAGSAPMPGGKSEKRYGVGVLLLLALFGFTPQAGLYFVTVKILAPGITSLLLYLYPAFVLVLSGIFFRRKPTRGQMIALALSFLGCLVTFFQPGNYPVEGLLLGVLTALSYGAYLVFGEKVLASFDSLFSTAVIMTVAAVVYWGWLLVARLPVQVPSSADGWLLVVLIALVATVVPITMLFTAMRRIGAANTSLISTIEPVSTVLLSLLVLGEQLTANRIVGGILILGGVVALRLFPKQD